MRQAMAAGIVASTLRRRTLRQKMATVDPKYAPIDISLSPTGSHPPSRSPSFMRPPLSHSPSKSSGFRSPKGTRLLYQDFWPTCINPSEPNLRLVEFETFEWVLHYWITKIKLFLDEMVGHMGCLPFFAFCLSSTAHFYDRIIHHIRLYLALQSLLQLL